MITAKDEIAPTRNYISAACLFFGAVGVIWYVRRLIRTVVAIHERGFVVYRGRNQQTFPYNRIRCVNEQHIAEGIPLADGIVGAAAKRARGKTARTYTVVRDDGEEFFFDDNIVRRGSLLAGPLRTA